MRERIAAQLEHIRHWRVQLASYASAPDTAATWFIDPPYLAKGAHYRQRPLDYARLAEWCRARAGQVIVCEAQGAAWLPFRLLTDRSKTMCGIRRVVRQSEMIWTGEDA